jgi:hypothetical protein
MAEQALLPLPAAHPVTEPEFEPRRQGPPRAGPGQAPRPGPGMGNAARARLMAEQPATADALSGVTHDLGLGNGATGRAIAARAAERPRRAGALATPPRPPQHPPAPGFQRPALAAAPRQAGPAAPSPAADPQQARQILEGATPGLDPGTRAAALSAIADPVVAATPATAVGAPSPAATAAQADAGATTSETGAEGGVTLSATDTRGNAEKGTTEAEADGGAAGGEGAGPGKPAEGAVAAGGTSGEGGSAQAAAVELSGDMMPLVPDTGAGALGTGDLVLIDVELAEHQRWAGALGRVGEVASLRRAEFIAEEVGSGFINGAASGLAMGLGMGVVTRFVPAIGPVIGGAMALHGLAERDWAETSATIGRFGEGNDTYDTLANSIASVAAVIEIVSQVLTVISGIVGVVQTAAEVIAGGAVVLAFFTFGATLGVAAVAADVVAVCEEISLAIGEVTTVLDMVNNAILTPCVALFRSLHTFTAQADPREVEEQGQGISTAAAASGSALSAWAGGKAAHAGTAQRPPGDDLPPSQRPVHETPPPAIGEGPTVHFQEPPAPIAHPEGALTPIAHAEAAPSAAIAEAPPSLAHAEATPSAAAAETGPAAAAPPREPEQLTLPGTEAPATRPPRRPLTPDEVAPPNTRSAYLRRLRAEAAGAPPPKPGRRKFNIARHELPDRANIEGTWESASPTPDLYQYSPRTPKKHESHHVEAQEAFIAPDGGEVIPGYNPKEDVTVMVRRKPEHEATFGAQGEQRAQPDFHETVGRPAALEEAHNIAVWGTRDAPPPGTTRRQMMDPEVAGQTAMEHSAYLFETSRLSGKIGPAEGAPPPPRPGETPLTSRPTVGELVGPRGGVNPFENLDWERTFNQPDPYRAAQPPGTQLGLPGMEHLATRPGPAYEQLTLPGIDQPGPNPNQLSLPFDRPPATPSSTPPPVTSAVPAAAPPISSTPTATVAPSATTATPVTTTPGAASPISSAASPTVSSVNTVSTFSAAAGAARTAVGQQTPGGPQPGPGTPTFGTRAHQVGALFLPQVFGGGGEAPKYAQRQAAHRARFTGDNQPAEGVERVNPDYPSPPATPTQITAIQNEIMNLLAVRAAAEQEAQHQADRAGQCEENQGPIQQTVADTTAGITAVQAHDAAVARREAVNQEQQQRQQESAGLVAGYPSRAAGLAALKAPLAAWEGFTSLASHLPGEAGDSMLRMNQEAGKMQEAFDQMGAQIGGVDGAGPANEQGLQDDQARLKETGELAQASDEQLHTASTGAAGLQQANEAALAEANDRRKTATERAQESGDAAAEREEKANSLAEQLRAWGRLHAQARRRAVAATEQRLQKEGLIVVESSEQ